MPTIATGFPMAGPGYNRAASKHRSIGNGTKQMAGPPSAWPDGPASIPLRLLLTSTSMRLMPMQAGQVRAYRPRRNGKPPQGLSIPIAAINWTGPLHRARAPAKSREHFARCSAMDGKDRKSVVEGKSVSVRVSLGVRGTIKKKNQEQ